MRSKWIWQESGKLSYCDSENRRMLHPILRTLVKVAVASLVVGTILAHFGITAEQLMREFGLSADRLQDYAKQGIAWA